MAAKTVSLALHRNTIERKRKHDTAREITRRSAALVRDKDIRAWAFVGIAADGKAYAMWDTGAIMPLWGFAPTIGQLLHNDIACSEVADDWRPALSPKGSTEHAG